MSRRLLEMPRKKTRRKQPVAVQDYDDDDPNRCWCFCRKPSGDRFLIQCDRRSEHCYQWYHGDCVGISTDKGMQMDKDDIPYVCPFCDSASLNLHNLPSFVATSLSDFTWRNSSGANLAILFDDLYSKIVHWRPNLFMVPTGSTGKAFVSELALLIQSFADGAAIEPFALKALMVMPALLLQKPKFDSKLDSRLAFKDVLICGMTTNHDGIEDAAREGSEAFEQQFLQQKLQDWISDIKKLSCIAESQPHAAYSAYCHGYLLGGTTSFEFALLLHLYSNH